MPAIYLRYSQEMPEYALYIHEIWENLKQAGAELGQAQLKLGLGFTSTLDSKWLARHLDLLYSRPTLPFYTILSQLEIAELTLASYS